MLLQFEKELAQAVEALTREQERARQAESEKQTQVSSLNQILIKQASSDDREVVYAGVLLCITWSVLCSSKGNVCP